MKETHWEVVVDHTCLLGEGPVWNSKNKRILWVDILNGEIHQFTLCEREHRIVKLDQPIGAITLKKSGELVAALQQGFANVDLENKSVIMIADPESHLPNNRFNDGKCDPGGRFWAGTMDNVHGKQGVGSLYMLNKDLSVSVKLKGVTCSNGLAWSLDHCTFYYIDSPTRKVVSYEFDIAMGSITNRKEIISFPATEGFPDGMTIDDDGMLWIAHWGGWKVSRWNPNTGKLLHTILLPVAQVTSCTFGGESLEDLYITSAKVGLSESELESQPLAGSLFVVSKSGFTGIEAFEFGE